MEEVEYWTDNEETIYGIKLVTDEKFRAVTGEGLLDYCVEKYNYVEGMNFEQALAAWVEKQKAAKETIPDENARGDD